MLGGARTITLRRALVSACSAHRLPPRLSHPQREKEEAARERADANARVQALLAELQAERANSAGLEVRRCCTWLQHTL